MQFNVIRGKLKDDGHDFIGIACFKGEGPAPLELYLEDELRDWVAGFLERNSFNYDSGEFLRVPVIKGKVRAVFLLGLGKREECEEDSIREASYKLTRAAATEGCESLALALPCSEISTRSRTIAEGAVLASYRFNKYLTPDPKDKFSAPEKVGVFCAEPKGLEEGCILAQSQLYARDLCNEPGNVMNPQTLTEEATRLASEVGLSCSIFELAKLEELGMGALTAVGRGSSTPPRLIHLTWEPDGECLKTVAFVGKGLTFDSGGLSLKPADGMVTMKGDKTGACSVLGAIRAVALLKLPVRLHVLIGAAENMPDGASYRPDDILRAYNGKTIEINNTDAEGRLTLADVLAYTCKEVKPDEIIDIATLTGACVIALGDSTAGLFSNNRDFAKRFLVASEASGERFWELPLTDKKLRKKIKSPVADLINSGGRYGGAITAAMFLEAFIDEGMPWIHLDIAGTDDVKEPYSYYTKGGTAYGTRTLATYLLKES